MSDRPLPRRPQAFDPDDPRVAVPPAEPEPVADPTSSAPPERGVIGVPTAASVGRGIRWGALFFSAMTGLAILAAGVSFARFVSAALDRDDAVGWIAMGLLAVGLVALGHVLHEGGIGMDVDGEAVVFRESEELPQAEVPGIGSPRSRPGHPQRSPGCRGAPCASCG